MATKRNALGVLMGIELVINGANINFVAFGSEPAAKAGVSLGLDGPPDRPVRHRAGRRRSGRGLAIALNFYNNHATIDVDRADDLKG
jgi:NADH:ubiquinone oxidoreductase subunit K